LSKVINNYEESDKNFINSQWRETINALRENYNNWENHVLKQHILKCAEIAERMIEFKILNIVKAEISSHLFKEFTREGIEVSDRHIQKTLPPEYKRNYSESELSSELLEPQWSIIKDEPELFLEQNQIGQWRINGERLEKVHDKPPKESTEPIIKKNDDTAKTIRYLLQCGNVIERIGEALEKNYNENEEYEKLLKEHYGHNLVFYNEQYAILDNIRSEIDKRNKWGDYEKIMSKFLIDTGQSTARIAELLNYSSKYGSIGIDRHGEFVDEQTKEFKKDLLEFLIRCPACHQNIYHKINENIEKYRKGMELEIELPL